MLEAHPHIGSDKLPKIVETMRKWIIEAGGEVHFTSKLSNLMVENGECRGIEINNTENIYADAVILATGHSSTGVYQLLENNGVKLQAKGFALGVRIEHPQHLVNVIQYHGDKYLKYLPAAEYKIVEQVNERGVYSFCMCPGGIIAPAATAPDEIVVNGWSPSKRNNPFANSGMVVSIEPKDYERFAASGNLAALRYQQEVEQRAYKLGGGNLKAPAQRLIDFVNGKVSGSLPENSYHPGTTSVDLTAVLPTVVSNALKDAMKAFGKKMKPYFTNEAILVATESRTSSPVRIPRDPETLQHPEIIGLFPCGEGAGYAGGIVSAAMDGESCAMASVGKTIVKSEK